MADRNPVANPETLADALKAIRYYRQQVDDLGARLLSLQETLTTARREASHARLIARLTTQLHGFAHAWETIPLGDMLVKLLVETLYVDCAALFERAPGAGELHVAHGFGLSTQLRVPLGESPPRRAASIAGDSLPADTRQALRTTGLDCWLWCAASNGDNVLLLGRKHAARTQLGLALTPEDAPIPEAVLELYLGLLARQQAEQALHAAQLDYRTLFESAQDAFVVFDVRAARMLDANRQAIRLFGAELDQLCRLPLGTWLVEPDLAPWRRRALFALAGRAQWIECQLRDYGGTVFWAELQLTRIGPVKRGHLLAVGRDISARKQQEQRLEEYAFRDELTQLPNRALLVARLREAITRWHDQRSAFALLFLDIDRFKVVNDSLGHSLGDRLLIAIGKRLSTVIGDQDTIARLGGDEFMILLAGTSAAQESLDRAQRLLDTLKPPFSILGHEIFTSASIGIVLANDRYRQPEAMLRDADIAMYRAKRGEHNEQRFALFDPEMHARALADMKLEQDLRHALERGEFVAYYQPIVRIADCRIKGFEALVRWRHPQRGMVPPGSFIPIAEENLLILDIGRFMLTEACRQAAIWADYGAEPPVINVNISGRQFLAGNLSDEIHTLADHHCCPVQFINLEITESAILKDIDVAKESLTRLHEQGFALSMDDFGTGYSSLSYLHQFPFDTIKIDRSFIKSIDQDADTRTIVAAIINLSKSLHKTIVAEGVETPAQFAEVRRLGCDYAQGYLFSPALEAAQAEALLAAPQPPWLETLREIAQQPPEG